MNKEYFTDNISDETLAKLIDETLSLEKTKKGRNLKSNLLKIVPVAAALLLVFGLVNIFPFINNDNVGENATDGIEINAAAEVTSNTSDIEDIEYETVTSEIGNLVITTLKGQEPIQNDDDTITLPGGGTYYYKSDIITVASGTVIRNNGTIPSAPVDHGKIISGDYINSGKEITIEQPNGNLIVFGEDGTITINGMPSTSMNDWGNYLSSYVDWDTFNDSLILPDDLYGILRNDIDLPENWQEDFRASLNFPDNFEWENNGDDWYGLDTWLNPDGTITTNKPSYTYDELIKEIYDEAVLVEKTYTNISSISLDIVCDNVVVSRGGDEVKIKYYEWTKDEYKLSDNSNGKLTLEYMVEDRYYKDENNNSMTGDWVRAVLRQAGRQIDPENPKADIRTIEITVPENVTLESLNIDGVGGNINISDCGVKKVSTDTVSGNVSISNCTNGQDYKGDTVSGNVTVSNCNGVTTVTGDTTSGNVNINNCNNIQILRADTTSGNINIKNSVIQSASADVLSGKITIQDSDIATLTANGKTYNDVKNETFDAPDWSDWGNWDFDDERLREQLEAEQERLLEHQEQLREQQEQLQENLLEQREQVQEQREQVQEQLEKLQEQLEAEQERLQEQYNYDWGNVDWGSDFNFNSSYWKSHTEDNNSIYELKDGTKITILNSGSISCSDNGKYGYIRFDKKATIEYPNGVKVDAPSNTAIEFENGSYIIIITRNSATLTKTDGTSLTLPKNTILDNQGNVVKDTSLLNIISKNFEYGKVKNVNIDALKGNYIIEKSDTNKTTVEVSGYEKFIDLLKFDYSAETGELKVSYDKSKTNDGSWNRIIWEDSKIKITIKAAYDGDMPEELKIIGSGTGTIKPAIQFKKLNVDISGVSTINADKISFDDADIKVSGVCTINLKDLKNCTLSVSGVGNVTGKKVNSLNVSISGAGDVNVDEVDKFTISSSGVGNITIGKVNKSVSATMSGWGEININSGNVETFYANVSSGTLNAKNVTADKADITVKNWGTVEIGKVTGELTKDVGKDANLIIREK